jgi:hypothetical protein
MGSILIPFFVRMLKIISKRIAAGDSKSILYTLYSILSTLYSILYTLLSYFERSTNKSTR